MQKKKIETFIFWITIGRKKRRAEYEYSKGIFKKKNRFEIKILTKYKPVIKRIWVVEIFRKILWKTLSKDKTSGVDRKNIFSAIIENLETQNFFFFSSDY